MNRCGRKLHKFENDYKINTIDSGTQCNMEKAIDITVMDIDKNDQIEEKEENMNLRREESAYQRTVFRQGSPQEEEYREHVGMYIIDDIEESRKGPKRYITSMFRDFPNEAKNRWKSNGHLLLKTCNTMIVDDEAEDKKEETVKHTALVKI